MTEHLTRRVALVAGLLLLAGCRGGSAGEAGDAAGAPGTAEPRAASTVVAAPTVAQAVTAVVPATAAARAATPVPAKAPAESPPSSEARSVAFTEPADGGKVTSPVTVCLAWTGVNVEAAGELRPGYGHILVMVDPTSQEARRASAIGAPPVPPGPTYIHYTEGESCQDMELKAGHHVLLGLLVDGEGVPLNPQTTSRLRFEVLP